MPTAHQRIWLKQLFSHETILWLIYNQLNQDFQGATFSWCDDTPWGKSLRSEYQGSLLKFCAHFFHEFLSSGYSFLGTAKEHCKHLLFFSSWKHSDCNQVTAWFSFWQYKSLKILPLCVLITHTHQLVFFYRTKDPRYRLWYFFQSLFQSAAKGGKILPNS